MTIAPTITVSTTAGLTVTTGSQLTYAAILNSIGVYVYDVNTLYYQASSYPQFSNLIQYSIYNTNGNMAAQQILTPISPMQFQPSMFVEMKGKGIILDSQSGFNFNMQANSYIRFIFYAKQRANGDFIDRAGGINNFKEVERAKQIPGFFDTENEDE